MHFELIFICHVIHDPPFRYVTINDSHHHIRIPWPSLGLTITLEMSLKCLSVVAAAVVMDVIWWLKTKPRLCFPGVFLPIAISLIKIKSQEHLWSIRPRWPSIYHSYVKWNNDWEGWRLWGGNGYTWVPVLVEFPNIVKYCADMFWWWDRMATRHEQGCQPLHFNLLWLVRKWTSWSLIGGLTRDSWLVSMSILSMSRPSRNILALSHSHEKMEKLLISDKCCWTEQRLLMEVDWIKHCFITPLKIDMN